MSAFSQSWWCLQMLWNLMGLRGKPVMQPPPAKRNFTILFFGVCFDSKKTYTTYFYIHLKWILTLLRVELQSLRKYSLEGQGGGVCWVSASCSPFSFILCLSLVDTLTPTSKQPVPSFLTSRKPHWAWSHSSPVLVRMMNPTSTGPRLKEGALTAREAARLPAALNPCAYTDRERWDLSHATAWH